MRPDRAKTLPAKPRTATGGLAVVVLALLLVPVAAWAGAPENSRKHIQQGYIATHDSSRLFYQKTGSGPVLIVPGRLFLFESFRQLADTHTLISYDMRNRGRSDPISDGQKLTIENDVRDLENVRRHFGVTKFTAVGYSYLGLMVVMYAMQYPEHLERIVQLGPVPIRFGTKYPPNRVAPDEDSVPNRAERAKLEQLQKNGYAAAHPKEYCEREWAVDRYRLVGNPANVEKLGPSLCDLRNEWPVNLQRHFQYAFVSVQKLELNKSDVARVKVPVLTIHGTKDRNAPYGGGREWAMILPDARLLTVQDAAHNSFAEFPEIVFPAIRDFLAGTWPKAAERVSKM